MIELKRRAKIRDKALRFYKICLMPPVKIDYIYELALTASSKN